MRPDSFVLEPVSPFQLDLTVWALRRRPDNVVDRWTGERTETVWPYTTAKRSVKEMSQLMRSPRRETWPGRSPRKVWTWRDWRNGLMKRPSSVSVACEAWGAGQQNTFSCAA